VHVPNDFTSAHTPGKAGQVALLLSLLLPQQAACCSLILLFTPAAAACRKDVFGDQRNRVVVVAQGQA
jgi:hypothetical protein